MGSSEIEEELKWVNEALAARRNENHALDDAHKVRFPARYQRFLSPEWTEQRLQKHAERLKRDCNSSWFVGK